MNKNAIYYINTSGQKARGRTAHCSLCSEAFPNASERARHTQSDHPKDPSGTYLPVERYRPKRGPASSGNQPAVQGTGQSGFAERHFTQKTPDIRRTVMGHSGSMHVADEGGMVGRISRPALAKAIKPLTTSTHVASVSTPRSVTNPDTPAAVIVQDQAAIDDQPRAQLSPRVQRVFECHLCHTDLLSKAALKSHRTSSHRSSTEAFPALPPARSTPTDSHPTLTQCIPCNRDFPTHKAYDLHLRNSTIHALKHHCTLCRAYFFSPGALVVHGVVAHGLELPCDQCPLWFATEERRAAHISSGHTEPAVVPDQTSISGTRRAWADLFTGVNAKGKPGYSRSNRSARAGAWE